MQILPQTINQEEVTVLALGSKDKKIRMSPMGRQEAIAGYLFFLPCLLGLVFLTYGQMIFSLIISFTDWNVFKAPNFIGIANYIELFKTDFYFTKSMTVTIYYALGSVLATQLTALLMALLLNVKYIRGKVFFRTLFYLPSIVPAVASCLLWTWMMNPDFGLLNAGLEAIGLPTSRWIYGENSAVPSMIMLSAWGCGSVMVIYLAGLSNVPTTLLEAIEIDGGGTWAKFRYITIPMISPVLFYNTLMGIIAGFMSFTNTYVMTSGGPNNQTLYVNLLIYRYAFEYNRMGYASALGWVMFIVLALITVVVFKFFGKKVYYGTGG